MAALTEIVAELDRLLDPGGFTDYCPNGLQLQGRPEISQITTGVSASVELFERAIGAGAELILTHHGLIWNGDDGRIVGPYRDRVRLLLDADVSLVAYHLPLDAHPTLGNNALIVAGIGGTLDGPFGVAQGREIGWRARFDADGLGAAELVGRVATITGRTPLAFLGGPERVRTVGIVSGGGARGVYEALEAGLDFIAAGHAATETFGVRALGEHLAAAFGVIHSYIEIENPV
jgi:putative NIF3 family GTP cyclohydrolase 1 type 2